VKRVGPFFVLLLGLVAGCAEGTLDGADLDVPTNPDPVDGGSPDTGIVLPEDTGVTPAEDTGNPLDDVGNPQPDLPASFEDIPVGPEDTGSLDDTGLSVEDRPAPIDLGISVDAGVRDAGRVDVPRTDTGSGTPDAGGACVSPRALCGGSCVDPRTDATHCGACNMACAGSTPSCVGGQCMAAGCGMGASDCDSDPSNGCELSHAAPSTNTCAAAPNLGSWCGDVGCGFLCGSTSSRTVATRTGRTSAWFRGRTNECSNCPARLQVTFTLTVPAGVDYDLFVYDRCGGTPIGRSALLEGQTDRVTIERSGDFGSDSFDWWVEVRYYRGSSCLPWSLTVQTRSNSGSSC